MNIKIAGAQLPVTDSIGANVESIIRAIHYAVGEKADILLTPEGSLSGYRHDFNQQEAEAALEKVTAKAREAGVGLALGTCFNENDGKCYNQIRMYDKGGEYLGFHGKILRCGRPEDLTHGEHEHYSAKPLEIFILNGIPTGCLICNDLWANPEWTPDDDQHLTRKLAGMGARIILHAVNSGVGGDGYLKAVQAYHESNLMIRANANKLWIATVNSCYGADEPCCCTSGVVTPDGNLAVTVPNVGEQYYTYSIELE